MTRKEWSKCEDGALMLEFLGKVTGPPGSDQRRPLVLAVCACARLALPYLRKRDNRGLIAIEAAERWANKKGFVTEKDELRPIRDAARIANEAANLADNLVLSSAVNAASCAAFFAANNSRHAEDAAHNAVEAAAEAAFASSREATESVGVEYDFEAATAAREAAKVRMLREYADIVRRYFPDPPEG
jgi:hypothetical protein